MRYGGFVCGVQVSTYPERASRASETQLVRSCYVATAKYCGADAVPPVLTTLHAFLLAYPHVVSCLPPKPCRSVEDSPPVNHYHPHCIRAASRDPGRPLPHHMFHTNLPSRNQPLPPLSRPSPNHTPPRSVRHGVPLPSTGGNPLLEHDHENPSHPLIRNPLDERYRPIKQGCPADPERR